MKLSRKSRVLSTFLFTALLFVSVSSLAEEPENLYLTKQAAIFYHDSGEYDYDISDVVQQAQAYLEKRIAENNKLKNKRKLAVVFDIDETSLSNYKHLIALDFGIIPELYKDTILKAEDPAIPATLKLYNYANAHGVAVFFITGRSEDLRDATVKNLITAGCKDWIEIYLKPNDYHEKSIIPFKTLTREKIQKKGYDIVVNIGDQYSDLSGGNAERTFKLPNPYYYIP